MNDAEEVTDRSEYGTDATSQISLLVLILPKARFTPPLHLNDLEIQFRRRKTIEFGDFSRLLSSTCNEIDSLVTVRRGALIPMATSPLGPASRDNKATMGTSGDKDNGAPIGWMDLKNIGSRIRVRGQKDKNELRTTESGASADPLALSEVTSNDGLLSEEDGAAEAARGVDGVPNANGDAAYGATTYKVYKRRWFGLFQLALLNIIVSWDVSNCFCLDSSLMELTWL